MNPPTEQLIRDYLNRVSVAARGKLGSAERREFLARMRESIERQTGPPGTAELIDVGKLLSGLGEPRALVERERARLAQSPDGPPPAAPRSGPLAARPHGWMGRISARRSAAPWTRNGAEHPDIPSASVSAPDADAADSGVHAVEAADNQTPRAGPHAAAELPSGSPGTQAPEEPPGEPGRPAPAEPRGEPPGEPGRPAPAEPRGEPGPPGGRPAPAEPRGEPGPPGRPTPAEPTGEPGSPGGRLKGALNGVPGPQGGPARSGSARSGSSGGPGPADGPRDPVPGEPPGSSGPASSGPASSGPRHWPSRAGAQAEQASRTARLRAGLTSARPARGSARLARARAALGGLAGAAVALARRHPLEASAIVLLGLGGLIYPPVWLLGAFIGLMSREWDFRDKWVGLAGPVLLMVVGTGLLVARGGHRDSVELYLSEAWMLAGYLSRAGAVLGTAYLTWRVQRGPREPPVPPWNRPQRPQRPQRQQGPQRPHRT